MRRRLRSHLTYANVISTICLVLILGGGAAYAANTVFSSDIVNGEVKTSDIGNNQVRSADVRDDDLANGGLTGAEIKESTLQGVDAGTVGGLQMRKINFQPLYGTGPTTVLNLAGLQITAECQTFGDGLDVKAFTSKNGASVSYFAGGVGNANDTNAIQDIDSGGIGDGQLDIGEQFQIDDATPYAGSNSIGTLIYSASDGSAVVAHLDLDELAHYDETDHAQGCALAGMAVGG